MKDIINGIAKEFNTTTDKVVIGPIKERENHEGKLLKPGRAVHVIQGQDDDLNFVGWLIGKKVYK